MEEESGSMAACAGIRSHLQKQPPKVISTLFSGLKKKKKDNTNCQRWNPFSKSNLSTCWGYYITSWTVASPSAYKQILSLVQSNISDKKKTTIKTHVFERQCDSFRHTDAIPLRPTD